jgi:hypothetical protein
MITIAETVIAVTTLCNAPSRKRSEQYVHYFTSGSASQNCFQVSSGISLERRLRVELEEITGVHRVAVKQDGDDLNVNVVLETLEFAAFEKVILREMEISEQFPNLRVHFNVEPFSPEDSASFLDAA